MTDARIDIERSLREAERALARREYERAHAHAMGVLQRDPRSAVAYYLLGVIAAEHANPAKALEVAERGLSFDAANARLHALKARCLVALNQPQEAADSARTAGALEPKDALTLDTLGVVLTRAGFQAEALRWFERAVAKDPSNPSFWYNLGACLQFVGELGAAADAYRRTLAFDASQHRAHSALAQLGHGDVKHLETEFTRAADDPDKALHLGHAIAKRLEDAGEYERAFDWLERAKSAKRRAVAYDAAEDGRCFGAAQRTLDAPHRGQGHPSRRPIFVIGMPRTGTTLVDRILSSHPDVTSAGELTELALTVKRLAATSSNRVLDAATLDAGTALDPAAIGERYLEATRARTGATPHFVDKMPLNFFYAALIHRALPGATIVCLRRHPMDTCLSNFRQLFSTSFAYYNYAYDLDDVARYYVMFDRLVARLRAGLAPNAFLEVHYDALVADQEAQTRRLLSFCDLEWNDACLAFHENRAPVTTASSVQVRSPLYRSASGRWRHYGDRLAGLRAALQAAGCETD